MNMLTSSNQYLRPEYLSPLPTTLDAKKSPLALLAQTCSNIGADNPNNKPIISPLEKPKDSEKNKEKINLCDDKSSFKPYDKKEEIEGKKSPRSKTSSPATGASSPIGGSVASCGKISPSGSDSGHGTKSDSTSSESVVTTSSSAVGSATTQQSTLSGLGYTSSLGLELSRLESVSKEGLGAISHLSLGAYKHGLNGALSSLANCTGCSPLPSHMVDPSAHSFPPGMAQVGGNPLKPGSFSALSPYVGYARVKTVSGGTTLVPVCRDPYCTNCQFSMQSAQLSACPSGCTQCTHDRMPPQLGVSLAGLSPSLISNLGGAASQASAAQLYSHSMLPRPNVCSWMVGDTYCGKRFTTSEELLQHLRTHTNLSATDNPGLPLISPSLSLPSASVGLSAAAAACHLHYSTAPSFTSPAGLRRTYPTSLSPVSTLTASRYHPYKPPMPGLPGGPLPPIPHPGLGMYYSPYSIYGQRLGPPVHP